MVYQELLSDFDHPSIVTTANELTYQHDNLLEKIEAIFHFVRDEIKFGFTPKWDIVKASEVLEYGVGYCNTKATLFLALAKASNIPVRIHCGLVNREILSGLLPARLLSSLPQAGPHSWIELEIEGKWESIDSYINDKQLYNRALALLQDSGRINGYSISLAEGQSSCEINFGEKGFVHMGALVKDHGVWEDYSEYISSNRYMPMNDEMRDGFPVFARLCNRSIERIRNK
jgi:hypothetical protein